MALHESGGVAAAMDDDSFYAQAPRLFHLILGQPQGGLETFFVKLALALERRGVTQRAVVHTGRPWAQAAREGGVDVREIAFGGVIRELAARRRLRAEIDDFAPAVALAWMGRAARRLPKGPFVRAVRLPGFIGTRSLSGMDCAVVTTRTIADYVSSKGIPRERVHVIPNFGDLPIGEPLPRATHDTPDDAPLLLALGRFVEKKGFDVLLEALAKLPGFYLWLAGSGELEEDLRRQAASLGVAERTRFLGWTSEQERLFAAADVCVVPSRSEPFGNVVVEAWHAGCPLVATRSEGPGLIVTHEEDGLLVPIGDPDALAAAVTRVTGDAGLRRRLIVNGRRTNEMLYSEEAICRRYVTLFRSLVVKK